MMSTPIESSLLIAESMMLMPCGHPDALGEVQRQMRLINTAYHPDVVVLRLTEQVVQAAAKLHDSPGAESEELRRGRGRGALAKLWTYLELLPDPKPRRRSARSRVRY